MQCVMGVSGNPDYDDTPLPTSNSAPILRDPITVSETPELVDPFGSIQIETGDQFEDGGDDDNYDNDTCVNYI